MRHFNSLSVAVAIVNYFLFPFFLFYPIFFFLIPCSPDFPLFHLFYVNLSLFYLLKFTHLLLLNLNFNAALSLCITVINSLYLLFAFNADDDNDFTLLIHTHTHTTYADYTKMLQKSFKKFLFANIHTQRFALPSIELKCYSSQCINKRG